ncbi:MULTISPECIES: P-type conjugative transfer protein TrbG [unclassified Bartonella]|uniref:P-type conjugative transfer protein TrbG n=2 Tax=unclassified Bartonella TaxID=2645622 RepID=UPI000999C5D0|nr:MULTISPECIES: P-type conjugative transfer protein TrbG [unclassified Bartonella]AQX22506.1 type IV secretion system protein VirB9 [Bartonella sp. 11B]AQX24212.1 type IV secretion system protein VirB9 [Bartonella sp. 114]AQX24955.1 type IV secretion system protein VirB9 [Bartonella sp. Coyote22sub2]
MFKKCIIITIIAFVTSTAMASDLSSNISIISPQKIPLGLKLANQWKNNPTKPIRSSDGSVKYLYGATLPTLVCTPLEICTIQLQVGETINSLHAGDTARWKISPSISGTGATETTYVVVKPTDAGLTTNLFITTDKRTYMIKLASTQNSSIPVLSFAYPDDTDQDWAAYKAATDKHRTTLPTGQNMAALDFNFRITISDPKIKWYPKRVYTDGFKTYIELPGDGIRGEAPALIAIGDDGRLFRKPSEKLINYRIIGNRYVVDTVITKVALISGVGNQQQRVTITKGV